MSDIDAGELAAPLIGVCTLQGLLGSASLSVIDASWYLPDMQRDAHAEYLQSHIPGAVFFDIDTIADRDSGLPHSLASPEHFARDVGALGVRHSDTIVVYDGAGLFSAARVWWNFRLMGARDVRVLHGGFPAWVAAGLPVASGRQQRTAKTFDVQPDLSPVADLNDVMASIESERSQIIDARPAPRFNATQPEPRAGMRSGHMPGALNLPFQDLLDQGKLKSTGELRAVLAAAGVDPQRPLITTCGSGVTAAIISLALEITRHRQHRLYDGSWSEWGGRDDTPVVT